MPSIAALLRGTGAVLMLHAAYSCMHYRSILMDLDLLDAEADGEADAAVVVVPPLDVLAEVAIAFGLLLLGELTGMGPLQPVDITNSQYSGSNSGGGRKNLVAAPHKTRDFDIYTTRSKLLLFKSAKTH